MALELNGITDLWKITQGTPDIRIAILDGPVNMEHPALKKCNWKRISGKSELNIRSFHGSFITSIIGADHASEVQGIAPKCHLMIRDIYQEKPDGTLYSCSQSDIAAGIFDALEHNADIINISGGEPLADSAEIMPRLVDALDQCEEQGVLVVAATGNEGDDLMHVPARYPSVLAVGSVDAQGLPSGFSNWTQANCRHGIVTIGENIKGAFNQNMDTTALNGTSFSTALVTGIAALLASWQQQAKQSKDLLKIRQFMLNTSKPCTANEGINCARILAGRLHIPNLIKTMQDQLALSQPIVSDNQTKRLQINAASVLPINTGKKLPNITFHEFKKETLMKNDNSTNSTPSNNEQGNTSTSTNTAAGHSEVSPPASNAVVAAAAPIDNTVAGTGINAVTPAAAASSSCNCQTSVNASGSSFNPTENQGKNPNFENSKLVLAIGQPSYNFGNEATQDIFKAAIDTWHKQLHPELQSIFPNTPFSELTMAAFLLWDVNHSRINAFYTSQLIWVLSMNATPVYSITPGFVSFSDAIYLFMATCLGENVGLNPEELHKLTDSIVKSGYMADENYKCNKKELRKQQQQSIKVIKDALKDFSDNKNDVMRMSLPGYISGQTKLMSGSSVESVTPVAYGINNWTLEKLIETMPEDDMKSYIEAKIQESKVAHGYNDVIPELNESEVIKSYKDQLISLLQRLYINTINKGHTPDNRALNYSIYNIIAVAQIVRDAAKTNMQFSGFKVVPSKIARQHSEMRDVQLTFFNPENTMQASTTYAITVDVSAITPVIVGNIEQWQAPISVAAI